MVAHFQALSKSPRHPVPAGQRPCRSALGCRARHRQGCSNSPDQTPSSGTGPAAPRRGTGCLARRPPTRAAPSSGRGPPSAGFAGRQGAAVAVFSCRAARHLTPAVSWRRASARDDAAGPRGPAGRLQVWPSSGASMPTRRMRSLGPAGCRRPPRQPVRPPRRSRVKQPQRQGQPGKQGPSCFREEPALTSPQGE